ncbi:MAG: dTDP-4-dehydrorhamnose reductase [Lachnospiraceae bacterium]
MEKVLITGAFGQLGRSLISLLEGTGTEVASTDSDTLDICDYNQVQEFVSAHKPDTIINCAAYTAVDKCETDALNAERVNAKGPENLAVAAAREGAQIVQVSTDYVFDGMAKVPYTEEDKTNPQSVYGRTKLEGEKAVIKNCDKYFIVRTAWLYGEGSNFVRTMLKLADERDKLTVVNDQYGTPTSSLELARMILNIIPYRQYGIYHGTCEGSTNWYEFACEIMKQAGKDIEVLPVTTDEYQAGKNIAARPAYSVLENKKLNSMGSYRMKEWKEALTEYMHMMGYSRV